MQCESLDMEVRFSRFIPTTEAGVHGLLGGHSPQTAEERIHSNQLQEEEDGHRQARNGGSGEPRQTDFRWKV